MWTLTLKIIIAPQQLIASNEDGEIYRTNRWWWRWWLRWRQDDDDDYDDDGDKRDNKMSCRQTKEMWDL